MANKPKTPRTQKPRVHTLPWRFEPRTASEILGARKYATPEQALRELVANGFNAGAKSVRIDLVENKMLGIESITVSDDGDGMKLEVIRNRFVEVGTLPDSQVRPGRFGIGRLAVYRLGKVSHWTTVTNENEGRRRYSFTLRSDSPTKDLRAQEFPAKRGERPGTRIEIRDVLDDRGLTEATVVNDLLQHFCGLLLAEPELRIFVNESTVDVQQMVDQVDLDNWKDPKLGNANIRHVILKKRLDTSRSPGQLIFTAKGREVHRCESEAPLPPNYLAVVECAKLEDYITSQRVELMRLDSNFEGLRRSVEARVSEFWKKLISSRKTTFINQARAQPFYPFREHTDDPVKQAQQEVYDVVLEKLNNEVNVGTMPAKQQRVLFSLLKRALENENLIEVLSEVANLSDEEIQRFREVLERTTLDSIIKLSTEVTNRLDFLDHLHALVYGPTGKFLKERAHLHVMLEPYCWLFGPQFHLATSDQSFRSVIAAHRVACKLSPLLEPDLDAIHGIDDIPDLFLVASKDYPVKPKHQHLLVELKAPRVTISMLEHAQAVRYAQTVAQLPSVPEAVWDVYLVSKAVNDDVDFLRKQTDKPLGLVADSGQVRFWVFSWTELIDRAKDELALVRENLKRKSQQLNVSSFLKEKFPDVLAELESRMQPTPETVSDARDNSDQLEPPVASSESQEPELPPPSA